MCMSVQLCLHTEARGHQASSCILLYLIILIEGLVNQKFTESARLVGHELSQSTYLYLPSLELYCRQIQSCPAFYMDVRDLNSGLCSPTVSALTSRATSPAPMTTSSPFSKCNKPRQLPGRGQRKLSEYSASL